jgi:hypothetical protein
MNKVLIPFLMLTSFSLVFSQPIPFEPDANTVGLWHFNEGSGDIAYDTSGNNLDGTLENGVTWDPDGMFGNCLMFNADYERVRVADTSILDIPTDLTIEAWINLDSTHNESVIINKWNTNHQGQYYIGISTTHKLYCLFSNYTSSFQIHYDSVLEFNEWMLVSAVFSNGKAGLFINNEQVASSEVPFDSLTTIEYPNDDLFIGDVWTDQWYPYSFDGKIDEVRISNIARYQINLVGVEDDEKYVIPLVPFLERNYPNPFNPSTKIKYQLVQTGFISLKVFDVLGNEIAQLVNEEQAIGIHTIEFNAANLPSGIYFYRLASNNFTQTKKMILLK